MDKVSAPSEELAALHAQVRHYESELTEHQAVIAQRDAIIEHLQEQVRLLLARRFAPSSEKIPDGQLGLFNEAEATAGEEPESAPATEVAAYRRGTPKRAPIPQSLPRIDIEHRLPEDERTCPHHGVELERFGEVVSEQLDIIPMQVRVLRHVRGKYRCPCCEGHLRTAAMPAQPVPKSLASPGLLACIATAKYADALPLYRQCQQFQRIGVELSRTTLATWMVRVGELVVPLINVLRDELVERPYLLMDETTVQVLKEPGKTPQSKSQLWAQMSAGPEPSIVLFEYDPTRAGDVPKRLLAGFTGALHTDGYSGYAARGARAGTGPSGLLDARSARIRRRAQKPRAQCEEAAGESAGEGAARTLRVAANPNAVCHRAPHPRQAPRLSPPRPPGRERPGARQAARLARRHHRDNPAVHAAGQGDGVSAQPVEGARAFLSLVP